jgi:hypothetical protein
MAKNSVLMIISLNDLNRTNSVLVDAHSLRGISRDVDTRVPRNAQLDLTNPVGAKFANLIQNLVLYETLVVDSVLFEVEESDFVTVCQKFPDAIRGLFVTNVIREEVGWIVAQVVTSDNVATPPPGVSKDHWALWNQSDSLEKSLVDQMQDVQPKMIPLDSQSRSNRFASFPACFLRSDMTLGRAHFYLELSRRLQIPISVDPIRSRYFETLLTGFHSNPEPGTPERIIATFEKHTIGGDLGGMEQLMTADLSIPAVPEYVLRYAGERGCTLYEAIMEVRGSKNAIAFRGWCSQFAALSMGQRAEAMEQRKMLAELSRACDAWKVDVAEEVDYRTRTLQLGFLPKFGGMLKALNVFQDVSVKDKIIRTEERFSYFLFLNDLLRKPR